MRRLFGTDGIRGIANSDLSCERAMQIGRALGTVLSNNSKYRPKVVIGMDTRISSDMLCAAISAGLSSVGADVEQLGVVSTPAVAFLVKKYRARAGIMISASHNPYNYNGIKIFNEEGFKLPDELEELIESIVLDHTPPYRLVEAEKIGQKKDSPYALHDYIYHLSSTVGEVDLQGMRVAIDCANGSASTTAQALFAALHVECHMIADRPNGININQNCGSMHLDHLKKYVVENGLDAGLAFDGDADRFLAVDEKGNEVDGDMIMAILALEMKRQGKLRKDTVVGTVMTNFGFTKFCEENGIRFISTKVGDRYVLEELNREGYVFGGEQSGHIIFREHATTGDGQLTALQLLTHMHHSGKPLSELAKVMRKYPQHIVNIRTTDAAKIAFFTDDDIKSIIDEVQQTIGTNGRLVIRPSGTEPVIRVMVEGEDEESVKNLTECTARRLEEKLKNY